MGEEFWDMLFNEMWDNRHKHVKEVGMERRNLREGFAQPEQQEPRMLLPHPNRLIAR